MLQLAPAFHVPLPAQDDKKKAKKLKMLGFPNCPMCGHDWLCSGALRLSCMPLSVNSIRKMEKKAKKEVPEWNLLSSWFLHALAHPIPPYAVMYFRPKKLRKLPRS